MIGQMPEYMKSEYYRDETDNTYDDFLTDDAPEELKREFEEIKNSHISFIQLMKEDFPDVQDPYYTWDGKVIEKGNR